MQILIVEDDSSAAWLLQQGISEAGYVCDLVTNGLHAVLLAQAAHFDLILLDLMLPHLNGFGVTRELRQKGIDIPILIISAKDTMEDKIESLDAGADDYIVKPFQVTELLARMRSLLRRPTPNRLATEIMQVEDLTFNPLTRQATRAGQTINLARTEAALLECLMRQAGQVQTRTAILHQVWEYDFGGNDNVLDVYVSYLRRKLDKGHPRPLIQTIRGAGFMLGSAESH